ncbi:MAG: hypothetical protein WBL98_01055, partial [Pseudolabrys sp.]
TRSIDCTKIILLYRTFSSFLLENHNPTSFDLSQQAPAVQWSEWFSVACFTSANDIDGQMKGKRKTTRAGAT